ncbi:flavin-containing monooxygenase [Streptomyces albidus (ex Kaewkla and Franco 2022)]|uniref:flavin-containing monooxygenase n=1 Tax=Streptomyces albidus (ex Kaewkla and Franco 2022) TaxID=722709 RepID=UPI0015EF1F14|nr:NAD(P)/FAD-dependent oxidoreductase [Streptomyces albidus (ex Kaewkla and Franco 2022)]
MTDDGVPVHIIGAGPGGLATAAALHEHGISTVVLEKSPSVAASWRAHYDRLHLHTTRRWSSLPGLPIPRSYGRWVARDDFVRYLESYTEHHGIEVATGVEVDSIERHKGEWALHANGGRRLATPVAVVATGFNHTAHMPSWPGREGYEGELLHASRYRNSKPYAGKDVLVVGVGNTGAEIAVDLAEGGATRVRLAVRTAPHIVRRSTLGWPAQANGVLCRRLPTRLVDVLAARMAKVAVPDLSKHGLPRPDTGLYTRARQGAIPIQDVGLISAVRKRKVEPVAAVESFDGSKIQLADGTTVAPDVVIAATGFRRGLEDLVGGLGVLNDEGRPLAHGARTHPEAPGLHFIGYTNPLSGMLRELSLDAQKIARAIARATR